VHETAEMIIKAAGEAIAITGDPGDEADVQAT